MQVHSNHAKVNVNWIKIDGTLTGAVSSSGGLAAEVNSDGDFNIVRLTGSCWNETDVGCYGR